MLTNLSLVTFILYSLNVYHSWLMFDVWHCLGSIYLSTIFVDLNIVNFVLTRTSLSVSSFSVHNFHFVSNSLLVFGPDHPKKSPLDIWSPNCIFLQEFICVCPTWSLSFQNYFIRTFIHIAYFSCVYNTAYLLHCSYPSLS